METVIVVSPTLSVIAEAEPPFGYGARIDRMGIDRLRGGCVNVELEEIEGLVSALNEAAARLRAHQSGEVYQGDSLW